MTPQEAQLKAQQQQNLMLQQRIGMKSTTTLYLNAFAEQLSNFRVCRVEGKVKDLKGNELLTWNRVATKPKTFYIGKNLLTGSIRPVAFCDRVFTTVNPVPSNSKYRLLP